MNQDDKNGQRERYREEQVEPGRERPERGVETEGSLRKDRYRLSGNLSSVEVEDVHQGLYGSRDGRGQGNSHIFL